MRGKALLAAVLTAIITVVIGCHHDKRKLMYTPKEEAVLPPNEDRFNNPPLAEYRPPVKKNDDPNLMNKGGKMGGMGSGGQQGPVNPGGF